MNETFKKLTEGIKAKIAEQLQSKEMQDFIAATKAAEDTGSFEVVISTADVDRDGESIDQNGWDLSFYQLNPVVLWAHDYSSLPIGISESIAVKDGKLIAMGKFAPESANPFAQQVRRLYDLKIVRATSVGFIAQEMNGRTITKAQLLEFSFVPVPANPYALSLSKALALGLNTEMLAMKGIKFEETKGAIPYADHGAAPEDAEWDAAKEVQAVGDDYAKLKEMCAWYDAEKPDVQASYKLPHHQADGLKAVWKGVAAAMAALLGARGGVDIPESDKDAVYAHLAKHYKKFDKEPPEKSAKQSELPPDAEEGDDCTMPDGSPGTIIDDGGQLICAPKIEEKPETTENYVRIPVQDAANYDPDSIRTIDIDAGKGIKALVACPKGSYEGGKCNVGTEIITYLFDKDKWSEAEAQAWVDEHKKAASGHEGEPLTCPICEPQMKTAAAVRDEAIKTAVTAHEQKIAEIIADHYHTKQAINPNDAPPQKGGAGEASPDGATPKQRSDSAGSDLMKELDVWINSPERLSQSVLRAINNATSEALRKFNERTRSNFHGRKTR